MKPLKNSTQSYAYTPENPLVVLKKKPVNVGKIKCFSGERNEGRKEGRKEVGKGRERKEGKKWRKRKKKRERRKNLLHVYVKFQSENCSWNNQSQSSRQAARSRTLALYAERNTAFPSPSCTSAGCLTHTPSCSCGTMHPQTLPRDGEHQGSRTTPATELRARNTHVKAQGYPVPDRMDYLNRLPPGPHGSQRSP